MSTLLLLAWLAALPAQADPEVEAQAERLDQIVNGAPRLPFEETMLAVSAPRDGWALGMVSWVAAGADGHVYLLQRGDEADPVIELDRDGIVVRSWGRGLFETPHAIRLDPDGNVWTADAASSHVLKFSPEGELLLTIAVGEQPEGCTGFCGTSDVGFGPNGRLFISDGYGNARILEYTATGERVREWGAPGDGPGEFDLPHSLVVGDGVIYVADRENGRIQRFDLDGKFLGMWTQYGRTFGLHLEPDGIWLASQHRKDPVLSPGWLLKLDRETGDLLGYVDATGVHGMTVTTTGEPVFSPGPEMNRPRLFRRGR